MPELPEVETVRRGLVQSLHWHESPAVLCQWHFARQTLRYPIQIEALQSLQGSRLVAVERRSKYLLLYVAQNSSPKQIKEYMAWRFSKATPPQYEILAWAKKLKLCRLVLHLGMTGVLRVCEGEPKLAKHDHVWLKLEWPEEISVTSEAFRAKPKKPALQRKAVFLLYNDVRRFGFIELEALNEMPASRHFASLGIEPFAAGDSCAAQAFWTNAIQAKSTEKVAEKSAENLAGFAGLDGAYLYAASRGARRALKPWLLDGKAVCGVGNIYCSEALWRAALHPERPASSLTKAEAAKLCKSILEVIQQAIQAGGTTLKDFRNAAGQPGYFQQKLYAYGRSGQACLRKACRGKIERVVQAQRATFFCGRCQR